MAVVHALGLEFGAIDMIKTKDRRYVFLEVNPDGQFGWIEDCYWLAHGRAIASVSCSRVRSSELRPTA